MSLFDKLRGKATQWAKDNPEKVQKYGDQVIRRAGDAANRATGGKYTGKIRDGQRRLDDRLRKGQPRRDGLAGNDGDTPSRADEDKGGL